MLLTALAQASSSWTGQSTLWITLEGHGREAIIEGVDLSRTVGWFTTIYPAVLKLPAEISPSSAIKAVKARLATP